MAVILLDTMKKMGIGRMGSCPCVLKFTVVVVNMGKKRVLLIKMIGGKCEKSICGSLFQPGRNTHKAFKKRIAEYGER